MQFALLGDVQFELITYFDGLEGKFGTDYAEHARIEGKPRLQWIGDKLDEWSLNLKFHQTYCDPEAELTKLRDAMGTHVPLPFVLATGDYKGEFVITDITVTSEQTDTQGVLVSAGATLSLREVVVPIDATTTPDAPAVLTSGTPLQPVAKNSVAGLARPNVLAATLKDAVNAGREMFGAAKAVGSTVALAKTLQNNPAAALEQLRYGIPGFGQVAAAADRFGLNLSEVKSSVSGTAPLLAMAGSVATEARSAMALLGTASQNNLMGSIDSVNGSLLRIGKEMDLAERPLARLSAKIVVREVV